MGPNPAVVDSRYSWRGSACSLKKMILLSMILSNPAVIDSRYSWRGGACLPQKMILPIPDSAKSHAIACQRLGAALNGLHSMILRILNPPHTGAQAEIGPEALTIGSGMDCDLILNDPLLQPEHCKVRLTGEGIEIELTGGAAHLDGEQVEKSPFTARAGQVLTIGSTHMAFGEAGALWDAVVIPTLRTLGGHAPMAMGLDADKSPSATPGPSVSTPPPAPGFIPQGVKIGMAVALSLAVVLILALFFYNTDQERGMESKVRGGDNASDFFKADMYKTDLDNEAAEKVADQIKREVSGATVTDGERSGKAFLRIFVRSRSQANEVQKIVNASPVPVFSEIVSLEEIEKSAEMMASMKGFALDVTFAKDGTAYWKGYLPKAEDWKEVQGRMEIDLPYIKESVSNLVYAADIEKRANALLAEAGIKTQLSFSALPREIIITGTIPENQNESWNQVCAKLREEFGELLTVTDKIGSGKAVVISTNPFHSPIAGVTLGAIPSVVLVDGQRIYAGAVLKDGSVLTSITETNLTFKGPKGALSIPIRGNGLNENANTK